MKGVEEVLQVAVIAESIVKTDLGVRVKGVEEVLQVAVIAESIVKTVINYEEHHFFPFFFMFFGGLG